VIEGLEPRAAVDIYALATVLYELLAGFTPFGGGHTGAVLRRHVTESVAPLPGLPEDLWRVIAQCLAKAPASRLRATELAARLREQLPSLAGQPVLRVSHPDSSAPRISEYDDGYDPHGPDDADDMDDLGHTATRQRTARRRGPAVPLVPGAQPDSSRDTHTSLRRPNREELAAFAEASRQERAAREAASARPGSGSTHRRPGARRSSAGSNVRRRRRLLVGVLALLVAAGALSAYKAFAGEAGGSAGSPGSGPSGSPTASASASSTAQADELEQVPVAGGTRAPSSVTVPLPGRPTGIPVGVPSP
jgi:serine/threonine-protein kinase